MKPRSRRLIHSPILWTLIILLVIARVVAPRIILQKTNEFLADFSPTYKGHMEDLDLSIIRGAYKLKGLALTLKEKKAAPFAKAELIDVSVAWREIFKGRLVTDIDARKVDVVLTDKVLNAFKTAKEQSKKDSKEAADKLFPVRIERLELKDSSIEVADMLSIPEPERWKLTQIKGRASNLTSTPSAPISLVSVQGKLFNQAVVQVVGNLNLVAEPPQWDVDVQMKGFDLPNANGVLKKELPLTITSGTLDLYGEMISKNNRIEGYVKPFMHKADIVADKEHFKGFKHAAFEVGTAAANLFFRSAKERTVATKVKFSYDDSGFNVNSWDAIAAAFKNGFSEKLPEGIDEEISLNTINKGKKL